MHRIIEFFVSKAQIVGGLLLFSKKDSLLIIEECTKHNAHILGIDGFHLISGRTVPSLENSIDMSYESNGYVRNKKLSELVNNASDDCLFEFIFSD